jgi:ketosteroid isomerase-like protein
MSTAVDVVRTVYDRLHKGDIEGVLAKFGNDCEVEFLGPKDIPFAGKYVGARGMGEALRKFTGTCEIIEFTPDIFHTDGDFVTVLGHEHCNCKATGREWRTRLVELFVVRDGKIRSFLCMYDTAGVLAAYSQNPTET